jgi:hypothetical protein
MSLSFVKHVWIDGLSCDLFLEYETTFYELRSYDSIANRSGAKKMIIVSGYHDIDFEKFKTLLKGWRDSYS